MKTIAAEVRYAELNDADTLADVHACAWRNAYSGVIPYNALNRMIARRGPDWWQKALRSQAAILVVEFAGRPVGYATLGRNRTAALHVEAEIYEIYLLPQYQGIGFGRLLFDAGRALLAGRGLKGLAVWALEANRPALDFYQALGGTDIAAGAECFDGVTVRKVAYIWP